MSEPPTGDVIGSELSEPSGAQGPSGHWGVGPRARRAAMVSLSGQGLAQLASLSILAGLYQVVAPESFGVMAMALPVVLLYRGIATLAWQAVLIQWPNWSDRDLSGLFWWNLIWSCAATILCVASGFLLAGWYRAPSVAIVTTILSPTILLGSCATFAQSLLERRLEWRPIVRSRLVSQCSAGIVALAVAWAGYGMAGLIVQQSLEWVVLSVLLWRCETWRPSRTLDFTQPLRLWSFQSFYTLASIFFLLMQQIDKVFLGWWVAGSVPGRSLLGLYSQASQLSQRPAFMLSGAWGPVLLSGLSRTSSLQSGVTSIVQGFNRTTALCLWPIATAGILLGEDLMIVLAGPQWELAGRMLQVFAGLAFLQGFVNLAGSLYTFRAATVRLACGAAIGFVMIAIGVGLACLFATSDAEPFPPIAVALSYVAAYALWALPYLADALRQSGVTIVDFTRPLLTIAVATMALGVTLAASLWLLSLSSIDQPLWRLSICLPVGALVYSFLLRRELRALVTRRVVEMPA